MSTSPVVRAVVCLRRCAEQLPRYDFRVADWAREVASGLERLVNAPDIITVEQLRERIVRECEVDILSCQVEAVLLVLGDPK